MERLAVYSFRILANKYELAQNVVNKIKKLDTSLENGKGLLVVMKKGSAKNVVKQKQIFVNMIMNTKAMK